ncbi:hypothetical protein EEB13_30300 [Rhodococcus sp. WS3]|nr:hypothetical protein EEB13_30300 [Rhodococcus sp. WS3]
MFEYLEIFHNRQGRHSALGMLTPIEFENVHFTRQPAAIYPGSTKYVAHQGLWKFRCDSTLSWAVSRG